MSGARRPLRLLWIGCIVLAWIVPCVAEEGYAGAETCAVCHEEVAGAFARTAHAIAPGWDPATGCESCHGPGEAHVEAGGTLETIRRFPDLSAQEASETCLDCHKRQEKQFSFKQSIHHRGDVACHDCHNPHLTTEKLLVAKGSELCATCHQAIASQFDLPRAHPIENCQDCHEPHAKTSLRVDRGQFQETCGNCHFEKTQPYLFAHDTVMVDGCVACHEVHGSPNRHLLKHETQPNLCYQCHSASTTPTWHSLPRFLNEKCTACHTAIHGSNTSPYFLEE